MKSRNEIANLECQKMEAIVEIVNSDQFIKDLKEAESFIQSNYEKLHLHWGIKNKIKLAAERLVRFHIWKHMGLVSLYNTPLSSDVAFEINNCVINVDCKTIDSNGNSGDRKFIQCEANQTNITNVPLNPQTIPGTEVNFPGNRFTPMLDAYHNHKPVLSFFIFINYCDTGLNFAIEGIEVCCLPHNQVVENDYKSDIINNFKTYKYMKELQAQKHGDYYKPRDKPADTWIEFGTAKTKRYYDPGSTNPIHTDDPLVWGLISKKYCVLEGGHTIRVKKEDIKSRSDSRENYWSGWEIIPF